MTSRGRLLAGVVSGGIAAIGGTAFYYRPHPDDSGVGKLKSPRPSWSAPTQLCDDAEADEPILMKAARFLAISAVAGMSRFYLLTLNDMRVKEDEQHAHLVQLVKERPPGTPIITVSNHCSTLDDPALFAIMMPWEVNLSPKKVRWAACSQEICFKNDALATFFGAGKVMPIQRGGGIDQKLLQDIGRRVAAGEWIHIFPEGKIFQTGKLEGRALDKAKKVGGGRFKWGIGKLIARSPNKPIVIPVYHTGMQNFTPINPSNLTLKTWMPQRGYCMGLVVGDPIEFDDLIEKHEKKVQLEELILRSRSLHPEDPPLSVMKEKWRTEHNLQEKKLYEAITRRIESSLKALEAKAHAYHRQIHGEEPPTIPEYYLQQQNQQSK